MLKIIVFYTTIFYVNQRFSNVYQPADWKDCYQEWELGDFSPVGTGPAFLLVIPPPNVTGELHMGHCVTIQDIMAHFKRLNGYRVYGFLVLIMLDLNKNVVDKALQEDGSSAAAIVGLLKKVWDEKPQNELLNKFDDWVLVLIDTMSDLQWMIAVNML